MDIHSLLKAGATVVAGQVDFRNKNIGQCVAGGRVSLTEEGLRLVNDALAESIDEDAAPVDIPPAPPIATTPKKPKKPAQATTAATVDDILAE